jgi:hypothetical protein
VDPDNPIVKLCAAGMQAEAAGLPDEARALYEQAWNAAPTDWERCVAAHYLARQQPTPQETLRWNEECLRYADAVDDETVAGFYPSLYLNIGHSHEMLGDGQKAAEGYRNAERTLSILPPGPYADMVRDGVARGLERVDLEPLSAPAAAAGTG